MQEFYIKNEIMNVEIFGAKFVNKGAELMLNAIIQKIKERYPQANIVLSCSSKREWTLLSKLGFSKKVSYRKHILDFGDLGRFIPRFIRKKYNIVLDKEIDIVFEASGFAYGDQWTYRMAMFMDKKINNWKKRGTKTIIMPQAFGPFEKKINARYTKNFIENANLVFVRDKMSLQYILKMNIKNSNVKLKPDFTILLEPEIKTEYNDLKNHVCLIPNNKVISTSRDPEIENNYLKFFAIVIKYYNSIRQPVFILNHEGAKDYELALRIQKMNPDIPIVWEKNPMVIKGIIGNACTVIGSRFHGLVSGLSQGVPSIAIGWSHKYKMLFEDFGYEEGVLDLKLSEEEIVKELNNITNKVTREPIQKIIIEKGEKLKKEADNMWNDIFKLV